MKLDQLPLVVVDTETTRLDSKLGRVWDLACLRRETDGQIHSLRWTIELTNEEIEAADPEAMKIGKFGERYPRATRWGKGGYGDLAEWPPYGRDALGIESVESPRSILLADPYLAFRAFAEISSGAIVASCNIVFDTSHLLASFERHDIEASWHYSPVDIKSYAAGAMGLALPASTNTLLDLYGILVPDGDRHTALGDARAALELFDAARERATNPRQCCSNCAGHSVDDHA